MLLKNSCDAHTKFNVGNSARTFRNQNLYTRGRLPTLQVPVGFDAADMRPMKILIQCYFKQKQGVEPLHFRCSYLSFLNIGPRGPI